MASERAFWENFCKGVGRVDLFEAHPGAKYADHAKGDVSLRRELQSIFETRTTAEWVAFGVEVNTPITPVNDGRSILDDAQFQARFPWSRDVADGADLMPLPAKFNGEDLLFPRRAPALGEHTDEILDQLLGYSDERVAQLRTSGALG
jgi:crotonobetainyl-CoA:carnitine CoA-transferase CaiB-like acyl-CoA transferase